jgi:cysteinyl-tRNA synthetase
MAEALLGIGFQVHGGGSDLVFPHHENEAAQTRAARGAELARLWMHNGMIQTTGEKMAKSLGNIAPLHEVLERHGAPTVLLYLLSGHYRQPLAFSETELAGAAGQLRRLREALSRLEPDTASPPDMVRHKDAFFDALANDFNTPAALSSLFEWVREANRRAQPVGENDLREMLGVLGLGELPSLTSVSLSGGGEITVRAGGADSGIDANVASLLAEREQARARRDFATADRLRDELRGLGWEIRDGPEGPELLAVE